MLTANEIRKRYAVIRTRPDQVAPVEYEGGILVPERCTATHVELARRGGADLHFQERVDSWTATPHGVRVRTSRETYEADRLVMTAGPWTGQILRALGLPLEVTRALVYWSEPRAQVK